MYQICILFLLIQQCLGIVYTVPDECKHRPSKGGCDSKVDAWYYNAILNQCKKFEYTGCGGNPNRFITEADCVDVCKQQSIEEKTSNISLRNEIRIANEPQLCRLPKDIGNCTDDIPSVYYDSEQRQCRKFTYTGCGGNQNRFEDKYQCHLMCGQSAQSRKLVRLIDATIVREVCTYQPIRGPCLGRILSWHYDTGIRRCRQFIYSGCGGNLNRFSSEDECIHLCLPPKPTTRIVDRRTPGVRMMCTLPIDEGNCTDSLTMWYFDRWSRNCYPFKYTGCGGNDNRFRMQKDCLAMCAPPISKRNPVSKVGRTGSNLLNRSTFSPKYELCHLPPQEGDCHEEIPRFYYDVATRDCRPFMYTGCNGNMNRFLNEYDCYKICSVESRPKPMSKMIGTSMKRKIDTGDDDNICLLPPSRGDCGGYELIWVFDTAYQQCRKFYYSGCGGNANQFRSRQYCIDTCYGPDFSDREVQKSFTAPPFCYMRPNPGRCSMRQTHFFHHPATRTCRRFTYGGCGGNPNRFETVEECESKCLNIGQTVLSVCTLPPITKTCPGTSDRWYYNREINGCELTRPDLMIKDCMEGANRSENSFISEEDCHATCVD